MVARLGRTNFILPLMLVVAIVTILGFTIPSASAVSCTAGTTPATKDCSIPAGAAGNIVSLRDVTDTSNVTKTTTVSLDKSIYRPGDSGQVSISDFYANLDSSIKDSVMAKLTSGGDPIGISVLANETGPSTSTFVGQFSVTSGSSSGTALHVSPSDSIQVAYSPIPTFAPRFQLTFDNAGGAGDAILSDQKLTPDDEVNNNFNTVIETASFTLANGATISPGSMEHIVLSYANSQLKCVIAPVLGCDTSHLTLWISPPTASPFHTFVEVAAYPGNPGGLPVETIDTVAHTISFDADLTSFDSSASGSWLFVLAFETNGAVGGASGGIVSPGLVLDILAGLGASENAVTPPSFGGTYNHYSDGLTLSQGTHKTIFDTSKYNQDIPTQVMASGQKVNMTFKTFEGYNPNAVIHLGLYIIPSGQDMLTTNSIGSIVYDKNSPVQVSDPNHILSSASASSNSDGKFQYFQFSFVPAKSYDKMSFLARAWNDHRYSADVRVHDAVDTPQATKTLPAGVIKYDTFDSLEAALEKDGFYKPQMMAHIHGTADVFASTDGGQVYWLYDTINHSVTLVIADKNDNELYSFKATLDPFVPDKKGDYGFMRFTVPQLNRADQNQEEHAMEFEAAKAMFLALENGLVPHSNW
jgi:hypothetical protein